MLGVRWAAAFSAAAGTSSNLLLIIVYLGYFHRFPKRTLNILSLMLCDLGNSALAFTVHITDGDKV
jgi:hypothetical protein